MSKKQWEEREYMDLSKIHTAPPLFFAKLFLKIQYGELKYEDCDPMSIAPPWLAVLDKKVQFAELE